MPALPVEGTAQSPALEQLVPPAKYPWKLATKGCEVVQVALADAPERCSTADGVAEALLLPQLQPQWCVIFDDVAPQQVQTSADLRCVLYAAEAVASALKLDEATDTGGGGATALKGPLKGVRLPRRPEVVRVAQGGGGGYGAAPLAYVKCDCGVLSKQQRTKLDQLLRHRAAAAEAMVILTRQRTGGAHGVAGHLVGHGGSLVASNCAPLAAAGAKRRRRPPRRRAADAVAAGAHRATAEFGARASSTCRTPTRGRRSSCFLHADTDAAAAAAAAAAPQPPLVADRPAGVRLLCALASRPPRQSAARRAAAAAQRAGRRHSLWRGGLFQTIRRSRAARASRGRSAGRRWQAPPRYSLPCHELPPAHDVPLYAVGATEMYIGSKGRISSPSKASPSSLGRRRVAGAQLACVGEEPPEKLRVQALIAPSTAARRRRCHLEAARGCSFLTHQPWLTAERCACLAVAKYFGAAEATMPPTCAARRVRDLLRRLHPTTHQLPRLACATPMRVRVPRRLPRAVVRHRRRPEARVPVLPAAVGRAGVPPSSTLLD